MIPSSPLSRPQEIFKILSPFESCLVPSALKKPPTVALQVLQKNCSVPSEDAYLARPDAEVVRKRGREAHLGDEGPGNGMGAGRRQQSSQTSIVASHLLGSDGEIQGLYSGFARVNLSLVVEAAAWRHQTTLEVGTSVRAHPL